MHVDKSVEVKRLADLRINVVFWRVTTWSLDRFCALMIWAFYCIMLPFYIFVRANLKEVYTCLCFLTSHIIYCLLLYNSLEFGFHFHHFISVFKVIHYIWLTIGLFFVPLLFFPHMHKTLVLFSTRWLFPPKWIKIANI